MSELASDTVSSELKNAPRNSTGIVLDAVREMHAQEQSATREALAEATGLKMSVIDDRTRALCDEGQLLRLKRGVFAPVVAHPTARIMSKTIMPDGWIKIEIGNELLTLTPRESRTLSALMAGEATQLAAIESARQAAVVHAELCRRLIALERQNKALTREADDKQLDLLKQTIEDADVYEVRAVAA